MKPPVKVKVVGSGKYRRGVALSKLLGGQIGDIEILIRATADPFIDWKEGDPHPFDTEEGTRILDANITKSHEQITKSILPFGWSGVPSPSRLAAMERLIGQLIDVFEPAIAPNAALRARESIAKMKDLFPEQRAEDTGRA